MKREFTCIICPNGCEISVDLGEYGESLSIEGQTCKKGEDYVRQELTHPVRTIATSVLVKGGELPLASVRLDTPVPKEMIFDVMKEISKVQVIEPLGTGDIVIENVLGLGVDVVITSDLMKGEV